MDELRKLQEIRPEFSEVHEIRRDQFLIKTGQETSVKQTKEAAGFQFWCSDKRRVWQARTNGFSFSHLTPYESWDALKTDARSVWVEFRKRTGAIPTRLAVRYINRFQLPSKGDFADYFATVPRIPPKLDTGLAAYLMQIVLPQRDLQAVAIITQTPIANPRPESFFVVLDIDLFRDKNVPQTEEEIWDLFDKLRDRKNFLFEESITDKAREVIR
jgi:uncharacterized protein (TIGR04255 family)